MPPSTPSRPVLVLDDDALIHAVMADLLRSAGHPILSAKTIKEAEALLEQEPLLAFVDFNLHRETGDEFVRRVRVSDRHWRLPMVMLTALDKAEVVRRSFVAGADDFIAKPVVKETVLHKVTAVLAGDKVPRRTAPVARSVLVVSPNEAVAALVSRLVTETGYTAVRAGEVGEAAQRTVGQAFDVAVLDLALPGDGAATVAGLLGRQGKPPPVLAVARGAIPLATQLPWQPLAIYDGELELEHLIKHLSSVLSGTVSRAERRQKPRVPFASVVRFRFYGDQPWSIGYGYDLSETGLFVRSLTPIAAKQPVEVQFRLSDEGPQLEAKGLSIWTNPFGPRDLFSFPYGMGLAFADFPIDEWTRVHEYVQQRVGSRR